MALPRWSDANLGTMRRAALWLVQEVGEGNVFTKTQLRDAFPDVTQIDRRMRDLRDFGWRIDTNREDISLEANEQRFIRQGVPVWEAGKGTRDRGASITANQRHEILTRDGHRCRSCGIGPGEVYAGTEITSQLDVARRRVRMPDGKQEVEMLIECNRCRIGNRELIADLGDVLYRISRLPIIEKKMLAAWIDQDARAFSAVEDVWAAYRTLPAESRKRVQDALA